MSIVSQFRLIELTLKETCQANLTKMLYCELYVCYMSIIPNNNLPTASLPSNPFLKRFSSIDCLSSSADSQSLQFVP